MLFARDAITQASQCLR